MDGTLGDAQQLRKADMSTELSTTTQSRGLALATFDDAFRFSKLVAGSEFAPKDFRGKPESCLLAIQHGAEIGLSPMQALQSIAVVNGRPSVYGDTALAVCLASPVCEYVRERVEGDGDAMVATCEAKRRGNAQATVRTFSVADAKKASLWGKQGPWSQYPRRMLQMRARGFALRDAFPDAMRGLVTAEEAQDYTVGVEVEPTPAPQPVRVIARAAKPDFSERPDNAADRVVAIRTTIKSAPNHEELKKIGRRIAQTAWLTEEELVDLDEAIKDRRHEIDGEVVETTTDAEVAS